MDEADIKSFPQHIFRAYDIRGIARKELNASTVYEIGRAIATKLYHLGENTIAAACDARLSSPTLYKALCKGLVKGGINVFSFGQVPTPLLYFATCQKLTSNGVMLTGSHNPKEYNGLKIVIQNHTLKEEELLSLYHIIQKRNFSKGTGQLSEKKIIPQYIQNICHGVTLKQPLKIVIDCGNAVPGLVAPELYRTLGCKVKVLFGNLDGHFPNHHPDPAQPKNLKKLIETVLHEKADIGLAFDGDGDRLGVVSNRGEIIDADKLLMLFSKKILALKKSKIIYDVKCSMHLKKIILEAGGEPILWKTGHALIKSKAKEINAMLAGEMSGHFFFSDRWYGFDDALYAGARLLEILSQQDLTSSELFSTFPISYATPEINIPFSDQNKFSFIKEFSENSIFPNAKKIMIDGLRVEYEDGFGLIRASNTTPSLVLRFEGFTVEALERIKKLFREQFKDYMEENLICF